MKKRLSIIICLVLLIFIFGCNNQEPKIYTPEAKIELSANNVDINSGEYSKTLTISIIKKDDNKDPISFVIQLVSPNVELMKFLNTNNEEIPNITTVEQSLLKEDRISREFKIWAKKMPGQDNAVYTANIELRYGDKKIDEENLIINVN